MIKSILFCLLLCFVLTGCGQSADEIQVVRTWEREDAEAESDDASAGAADTVNTVKIGMVTDIGGSEDDSFNQSAIDGLNSLAAMHGLTTTVVETEDAKEFSGAFTKLCEEDVQLCWGIGYNCQQALLESAVANPDRHFAIIDSGFEETPSNVTGVMFRAQEPSFLVGYIAGCVTGTGKVGYISGMESDVMDQFRYGFMAGVQYAAKTYTKTVEIKDATVGSFSDPDTAEQLADQMYREGCDIIYHAAGGSGLGVIESAKKNKQFVIGVDKDQSYLAPSNVLTSALKKVDVAVERVTLSYVRGEKIGGKTVSYGLTEAAVGIPEDHPNYRDEIYDAALLVEDKIKSGHIVPPDSKAAYDAFLEEMK